MSISDYLVPCLERNSTAGPCGGPPEPCGPPEPPGPPPKNPPPPPGWSGGSPLVWSLPTACQKTCRTSCRFVNSGGAGTCGSAYSSLSALSALVDIVVTAIVALIVQDIRVCLIAVSVLSDP
jgi:hypothetical protein